MGRLINGIGIGLISYTVIATSKVCSMSLVYPYISVTVINVPYIKQVPIYISEITPKNIRGLFASAHTVKHNYYSLRLKIQLSLLTIYC